MWGSKSKETLGQRHLDCCSETKSKVYAGEGGGKGKGRLLGTVVLLLLGGRVPSLNALERISVG